MNGSERAVLPAGPSGHTRTGSHGESGMTSTSAKGQAKGAQPRKEDAFSRCIDKWLTGTIRSWTRNAMKRHLDVAFNSGAGAPQVWPWAQCRTATIMVDALAPQLRYRSNDSSDTLILLLVQMLKPITSGIANWLGDGCNRRAAPNYRAMNGSISVLEKAAVNTCGVSADQGRPKPPASHLRERWPPQT